MAYPKAQEVLGRELPPPPLGACMIPIVEDYFSFIQEGMRVLEIGCGSWDWIKGHCAKVGAYYEGLDTQAEYLGRKTIATRIENLAELSFPDESFDLVLGSQSMEHWGEYGCSLQWGLYQCFRVCRQNGWVLMNVPIRFHGTWQFMLGELERLRNFFAPFSTQVVFHKWGSPSDPLPPVYPYPQYWRLHTKPAYVLDIHAMKDLPLPRGYTNRGASRGRIAQLLNYPVSFNVYRVLRKFGVVA